MSWMKEYNVCISEYCSCMLQWLSLTKTIKMLLLPGIKNDENICFVAVSSNKRHDL